MRCTGIPLILIGDRTLAGAQESSFRVAPCPDARPNPLQTQSHLPRGALAESPQGSGGVCPGDMADWNAQAVTTTAMHTNSCGRKFQRLGAGRSGSTPTT